MADSSALRTCWAMRRLLKVSVATAALAGWLRISPATRFSLRGETRMFDTIACASLSARPRGCFGLLISAPLRLLVGGMPGKGARRREFAELVPHHVLGHLHGQKLVPVVDTEGQANEL